MSESGNHYPLAQSIISSRRMAPKVSEKRKCYGLISGSRDGAWLETFYGWAGIRAIRGSQNRRGSQAARDLIRLVKDGNDVGITPDGSRGPKYEAKPGALLVAKASRSPVALAFFFLQSGNPLKVMGSICNSSSFFQKYMLKPNIISGRTFSGNGTLKQATL